MGDRSGEVYMDCATRLEGNAMAADADAGAAGVNNAGDDVDDDDDDDADADAERGASAAAEGMVREDDAAATALRCARATCSASRRAAALVFNDGVEDEDEDVEAPNDIIGMLLFAYDDIVTAGAGAGVGAGVGADADADAGAGAGASDVSASPLGFDVKVASMKPGACGTVCTPPTPCVW